MLNIASTAALMKAHRARTARDGTARPTGVDDARLSRVAVVLVVAAFVLLQAGNATVTSILTLYVTETLRLPVVWAGIALGLAAGLEIPALVLIGRLSSRFSSMRLIATGCLAGIAYYVGAAFVSGPVTLLLLQPLNAWLFAAIAGVGLPLFQQMIPRPGLATGLYMNTRRLGAIMSGPIIALGSLTVLANRGIFVVCAALTVLALSVIWLVSRTTARPAEAAIDVTTPRTPGAASNPDQTD